MVQLKVSLTGNSIERASRDCESARAVCTSGNVREGFPCNMTIDKLLYLDPERRVCKNMPF